jgi:hypothetical protein
MNRTIAVLTVAIALPLGILAYSRESRAQVVVVSGPPSEYVASYEPVYYNGFSHYFWHNHWYYRDHGAWRWYEHNEPAFLHDHRGEWAHHAHHWR